MELRERKRFVVALQLGPTKRGEEGGRAVLLIPGVVMRGSDGVLDPPAPLPFVSYLTQIRENTMFHLQLELEAGDGERRSCGVRKSHHIVTDSEV